MHYVADMLNMSRMRVYEVATFYTMFKRYVENFITLLLFTVYLYIVFEITTKDNVWNG